MSCSQAKIEKKWPNKEFLVDKQADGTFESIVFDTSETFGEYYSLQNITLSDFFLVVFDGVSTCQETDFRFWLEHWGWEEGVYTSVLPDYFAFETSLSVSNNVLGFKITPKTATSLDSVRDRTHFFKVILRNENTK